MMLLILNLYGEDLLNIGIYHFIQTQSVFPCIWNPEYLHV